MNNDTLIIIIALTSAVMWSTKISHEIKEDLKFIKTELAIVKTALIMQGRD